MQTSTLAFVAMIAMAAHSSAAPAAPGDLDPTFGAGGFVRDPMPDNGAQATAVAIDGSGRVVVAGTSFVNAIDGNFGVLRLVADGTPDAAFGSGGRASHGFAAGTDEEGYGVAILADGRIVVGGTSFDIATGNDFAALRLAADGAVDATFGNHGNGWMTSGRPGNDTGIALAQGSTGFLLGGYVDDGGGIDAAGFLIDSLGMPLPLFGDNGLVTGGADTNSAFAAALQPDGKVLLGGHADGDGGGGIALRFGADGAPDASFAGDGRADLGADVRIEGLHVLADGRIVAVGQHLGDAIVLRLLADGSADPAFGVGGVATLTAASQSAAQLFAKEVAVQGDGALVVAGTAISPLDGAKVLAFRVASEGTLDAGFGNGGAALVDAPNDLFGEAVALQADGAIVIAGSDRGAASSNSDDQFLVVRLLGGAGAGGAPVISIADASLVEGDAGTALMSFALSLSAPSDGSVAVDVATDLGTATPNVDYTPTTATLAFPNGATTLALQVPIIGDTVDELDETLAARLSAPVNATLGDAQAIGAIVDDDAGGPPPATPASVPGPGLLALTLLAGALALGGVAFARRRGTLNRTR